MAQIINDLDLGSYLGKQLGSGLSQGLNTLAQLKLQDIMYRRQQREQKEGLSALLPNLPSEQIDMLSKFNPQLLQMLSHPQGLLGGFIGQERDKSPYDVQIPLAPDKRQDFVRPRQVKRAMSKKALTQKVIDFFLQKANGNPEIASQLARKAGYAA